MNQDRVPVRSGHSSLGPGRVKTGPAEAGGFAGAETNPSDLRISRPLGKEADLRAHLVSLAAPTRAEEGGVNYDLYQSEEARHEFMRHEVWASAAALEAHKKAPHLKASWEKRQREGWTTQITVWKRVIECSADRDGVHLPRQAIGCDGPSER